MSLYDAWLTRDLRDLDPPDDEFDPICSDCGHPWTDHPAVVIDGGDQTVCPAAD